MLWTGAAYVAGREPASLAELLRGWVYALPLMLILTCHEFGHYIADSGASTLQIATSDQ